MRTTIAILMFLLAVAGAAGPAAADYDTAVDRALRRHRLRRANVRTELVTDDQRPTWLRSAPDDRALQARTLELGGYTEGGEADHFPAVVTTDRQGRFVLLRPRARVRTVTEQRNDCAGVKGTRAQRFRLVALMPAGARLQASREVRFDHIQVLVMRPPACNTIP